MKGSLETGGGAAIEHGRVAVTRAFTAAAVLAASFAVGVAAATAAAAGGVALASARVADRARSCLLEPELEPDPLLAPLPVALLPLPPFAPGAERWPKTSCGVSVWHAANSSNQQAESAAPLAGASASSTGIQRNQGRSSSSSELERSLTALVDRGNARGH